MHMHTQKSKQSKLIANKILQDNPLIFFTAILALRQKNLEISEWSSLYNTTLPGVESYLKGQPKHMRHWPHLPAFNWVGV